MTERDDPWRFIGIEPEPGELPPPNPNDLGDQLSIEVPA